MYFLLPMFISIAIIVFYVATFWKIFTKAGAPGWACIVPFYSFYVKCEISGVKNWWLMFIPLANIYIAIVAIFALAKSFGKDTGFGVGLLLLGFIFYPVLAFGDAQYIGPNGVPLNREDDLLNSLNTKY